MPVGSSVADTSSLVFIVLVNCPDCRKSLLVGLILDQGVSVPSQLIPAGTMEMALTSSLSFIVLVNCPDCRYSLLLVEPDHGVCPFPNGARTSNEMLCGSSVPLTSSLVFRVLVNVPDFR